MAGIGDNSEILREAQIREANLAGQTASKNPWIPDADASGYKFGVTKFPADLGTASFNGHALMININVPSYSPYSRITNTSGNPNSIYNDGRQTNFTPREGQLSRMETLRAHVDPTYRGSNGESLGNALTIGGLTQTVRRTTRIEESILLYMPSTVAFTTTNAYEEISLTDMIKNGGMGAITGGFNAAGRAAAGAALGTAARFVGDVAVAAGRLNNATINPRIEVLFTNTAMRTFDFTFLFAPTNEQESLAMENIFRVLRFHAAPEMSNAGVTVAGVQNPFFMTSPSEFDITFYRHDETSNRLIENRHLPRISTCALQAIDIDYAPTGAYATFHNGHSVHTRLTLRFVELEVMTKLRIAQGF